MMSSPRAAATAEGNRGMVAAVEAGATGEELAVTHDLKIRTIVAILMHESPKRGVNPFPVYRKRRKLRSG